MAFTLTLMNFLFFLPLLSSSDPHWWILSSCTYLPSLLFLLLFTVYPVVPIFDPFFFFFFLRLFELFDAQPIGKQASPSTYLSEMAERQAALRTFVVILEDKPGSKLDQLMT